MIDTLRQLNVVLQTVLLSAFVLLLWWVWRKHGHDHALALLTNTAPAL